MKEPAGGRQLEFFQRDREGNLRDRKNFEFGDPAFSSNKKLPIHRWVPWVAGFSQSFVQSGLERHLSDRGTVLDPFAGVGTTLLEANLAGHDALGFEINPYAAFASRTKLLAYKANPDEVRRATKEFLEFQASALQKGIEPKTSAPAGFRTRGVFYSPKVMKKVLLVRDFITRVKNKRIADLFQISFASTMITYSNYSYEPSLGRKSSVGRPDVEDFAVAREIARKLDEMTSDIVWARRILADYRPRPSGKVINQSFFDSYRTIQSGSIDLLITSPPYLNNYHYNRNTRPHLYWLNFVKSPEDMHALEHQNFGKFWQTVRELKKVELNPLIKNREIIKTISTLRKKNPDRAIYGGNGWANYAATYFNDCLRFVKGARWALRRRGTALVVIGNSILQGVPIPTDRFLGAIAESVGLELIDIHIPRATRVGNSIIQSDVRVSKAGKKQKLYEAVVELRKR